MWYSQTWKLLPVECESSNTRCSSHCCGKPSAPKCCASHLLLLSFIPVYRPPPRIAFVSITMLFDSPSEPIYRIDDNIRPFRSVSQHRPVQDLSPLRGFQGGRSFLVV